MSIAFLIAIAAVFIALAPHFIKKAREAKRKTDASGDGGSPTSVSGSSSSDCSSADGGGCD